MKVLLLVTLLAAIASVFAAVPSLHSKFHPQKQHGQPKAAADKSEVVSLDRRIIGGTEVGEGEAGYHVTLHQTDAKFACVLFSFFTDESYGECLMSSMICGGFVITPNWMVSAGHCTTDKIEDLLNIDGSYVPYSLTAHLVDMKFSDSTYSSENTIPISEIITHESYDQVTHQNDIALLKFKYAIPITNSISLACLAQNNPNLDGVKLIAYGHGTTSVGGNISDSLLKTDVPVVNKIECQQNYADIITDDMICAGYMKEGGKDTCNGDSGGPLTHINSDGECTIVGITSFGNSCALPDYPGVYTLMNSYISWITKKIGQTFCQRYINV